MAQRASAWALHHSLLRPAVLQILRAAGFHAARPSVIETFTEITARYLLLLAQTTAEVAYTNNLDGVATLTDVRLALQECGALVPSQTSSEEMWRERLRRPLESIPERNGLRAKEEARREAEDTADVKDFVEWFTGGDNRELARISGLTNNAVHEPQAEGTKEDYLTALKKKHSKTGEESRFQGTVMGKLADDKTLKIEGSTVDSLQDWSQYARERSMQLYATQENGTSNEVDTIYAMEQ